MPEGQDPDQIQTLTNSLLTLAVSDLETYEQGAGGNAAAVKDLLTVS
jgi:hypothetical protein